jgi:hypothetical protein
MPDAGVRVVGTGLLHRWLEQKCQRRRKTATFFKKPQKNSDRSAEKQRPRFKISLKNSGTYPKSLRCFSAIQFAEKPLPRGGLLLKKPNGKSEMNSQRWQQPA